MREALQSVTPQLSDVISGMIEARLVDLNVAVPGKVVSYDPKTQFATVEIQLQRKYESGEIKTLPPIPNVPVKHPRARGGKTRIHMPVGPGDDVLLVFAHRSLDNWKTQGGITDPADRRKFNISDAFALVGGSAEPDAFTVDNPDAIEVVNEAGQFQILPNGTVKLGSFAPGHAVGLADVLTARIEALEEKVNQITGAVRGHTHSVSTAPGVTGSAVSVDDLVPDTTPTGSSKVLVVT
jgi:hypothetical protein